MHAVFVWISEQATMSKPLKTAPQIKRDKAENGGSLSLVDPSLEYTDPTPDVHQLFWELNDRFFLRKLRAVNVMWVSRLFTGFPAVCTYNEEYESCTIRLSECLLKLRPRKDLIETLLHEMIHAYLFLHNKDHEHDRSEHGPDFLAHMRRINREAGTSITVFHEFDDEVDYYLQHWYSCDGGCQLHTAADLESVVKRYSDCPPGPLDSWWRRHQRICRGTFRKIHEPEGYVAPPSKDSQKQNMKT